jgi:hypothetical protein
MIDVGDYVLCPVWAVKPVLFTSAEMESNASSSVRNGTLVA